MSRPALEVADIFRGQGPAWRRANAGHLSLDQMKVMSAIETCRTAALGGHVARCENEKCAYTQIAYNSCRNRHCPKCQGAAAKEWLAEREAELLPVPYFHVVFSLPAQIADIAYQNKAVIYDILFKASAETMITIAADPKHLGARIGILSVLHTWGSALTHHPHVHMIVPGGGISLDGERWIACRPNFFLPVRVLSRLFRRLVLEKLDAAHRAGQLQFFGKHVALTNAQAFAAYLAPLRNSEWVVYSKRPFGGPEEVLRYLARYTHRVAISNRRLVALDDNRVTFKWKDYRIEGPDRYKLMTLDTHEFIRRFLMHVLPGGFHRIRYYGLLASAVRADNIARARQMLAVPLLPIDAIKATATKPDEPKTPEHPCPCCGGRMIIIETFERGCQPRYRPATGANQDRHLMTPSPPIDAATTLATSRWLAAGHDQARIRPIDSQPVSSPNLSGTARAARPPPQPTPVPPAKTTAATDAIEHPAARSRDKIPIAPAAPAARGTAGAHLPRFRALALFGRRPPERVIVPSCRRPKTCTNPDIRSRRARAPSWHHSFLTQPADEPRRHTARQLQ